MDAPLADPIEWWDFDELSGAAEVLDEYLRVAVVLRFGSRSVRFSVVPEDDTLQVAELAAPPSWPAGFETRDVLNDSPWRAFAGSCVRWGRTLTNHHGYIDGYQLEFAGRGGAVGDGIEMVVAACSICLGTTTFR